eukprot:4465070-Alexandrium_andersonii.AAC.1
MSLAKLVGLKEAKVPWYLERFVPLCFMGLLSFLVVSVVCTLLAILPRRAAREVSEGLSSAVSNERSSGTETDPKPTRSFESEMSDMHDSSSTYGVSSTSDSGFWFCWALWMRINNAWICCVSVDDTEITSLSSAAAIKACSNWPVSLTISPKKGSGALAALALEAACIWRLI